MQRLNRIITLFLSLCVRKLRKWEYEPVVPSYFLGYATFCPLHPSLLHILHFCIVVKVCDKIWCILHTEESTKPGEVALYAGQNECFRMFIRGFGNIEVPDLLSNPTKNKELCMHECIVRDACVGFTFRMINPENTYLVTNYNYLSPKSVRYYCTY